MEASREDITFEIAAVAARLVAEEGLEYAAAKRQAVKQLGLPARTALPDNATLESAVREHIARLSASPTPGYQAHSDAGVRHGCAQVAALHAYIRANTNHPAKDADRKLAQLTDERKRILAEVPTTMVMGELEKPRVCRVLVRGAYDKPGDVVTADIPSALGTLPAGQPKNRLSFARWVASRENPLTARVAVNRVWERLFGRGLVETTEDFGVRCAPPSHPELLDWLASEFM